MKCEILSFLSLKVGLRDRGAGRRRRRVCARSFALPLAVVVLPITFLSYRSDGASRKMLVAPATTDRPTDRARPRTRFSPRRGPGRGPLPPLSIRALSLSLRLSCR